MSDDAIFIYPSHPTAAPRHHEPWLAPADFSYCGIFNVLGVPVILIRLTFNEQLMIWASWSLLTKIEVV